MNKEQAIDLLDNLIGMIEDNQDNDYDTAFRMAIEALKAQLSCEGTTSDAISRQAAIDEIKSVYEWHDTVTMERLIEHINNLPTIQPERAIPLSWIEKHIKWLNSLDSEFANLAAIHISVMVKKWRGEQNETD